MRSNIRCNGKQKMLFLFLAIKSRIQDKPPQLNHAIPILFYFSLNNQRPQKPSNHF